MPAHNYNGLAYCCSGHYWIQKPLKRHHTRRWLWLLSCAVPREAVGKLPFLANVPFLKRQLKLRASDPLWAEQAIRVWTGAALPRRSPWKIRLNHVFWFWVNFLETKQKSWKKFHLPPLPALPAPRKAEGSLFSRCETPVSFLICKSSLPTSL